MQICDPVSGPGQKILKSPNFDKTSIFGNKTCLLATILLVSVENADEADDKVLELVMKKMLKMLKKLKMLVI